MATIFDVAAYVLERCDTMTTMKMQKLVFYSQAEFLTHYDYPLFAEDFQAWRGGPVCVELFQAHRHRFLIRPGELPLPENAQGLTTTEKEVINRVCDVLSLLSGNQLSERTHAEDPWKNMRVGLEPRQNSDRIISKESMREYYTAHPVLVD
ncbi:hypothetical protein B9G54_06180 [Alloscardovia macacae]|uniref:Antitoxin SocA-like Panacea domain-containing protein n=1 Tax=Alloscardovia macacae TaxID=1160091 RepID=A0A1Y2SVL9_9BIFI|nr:type II toxin-antitoxin system antitoxin SocA domain-containing protein [Alloscardovia macacae]OTA26041.1 hypothetical protein B9G54_06180 [Alloscardovia macacae]OTA29899.1 hypothetical protein B9T39_02160 [Alloscardovia macacae]